MTLAAHIATALRVPLLPRDVYRIWEHVAPKSVRRPPPMPFPGRRGTLKTRDDVQLASDVRRALEAAAGERREREALMVADGWMIPGVAA